MIQVLSSFLLSYRIDRSVDITAVLSRLGHHQGSAVHLSKDTVDTDGKDKFSLKLGAVISEGLNLKGRFNDSTWCTIIAGYVLLIAFPICISHEWECDKGKHQPPFNHIFEIWCSQSYIPYKIVEDVDWGPCFQLEPSICIMPMLMNIHGIIFSILKDSINCWNYEIHTIFKTLSDTEDRARVQQIFPLYFTQFTVMWTVQYLWWGLLYLETLFSLKNYILLPVEICIYIAVYFFCSDYSVMLILVMIYPHLIFRWRKGYSKRQ